MGRGVASNRGSFWMSSFKRRSAMITRKASRFWAWVFQKRRRQCSRKVGVAVRIAKRRGGLNPCNGSAGVHAVLA